MQILTLALGTVLALPLALALSAGQAAPVAAGGLAAAPLAEVPFGPGGGQAGYYNASCRGFGEVYPMGPTSVRGLPGGGAAILDNFGAKLFLVGPPGPDGAPAKVAPLSLKGLHPEMFLADFAPLGDDAFVFADQLRGALFIAGIDRAAGTAEVRHAYERQGTAEGFLYQPQLVEASGGRVAVGDFMRSRLLFFDRQLKFLREEPWDLAGLCLTPEGDFATLSYAGGTYSVLVYSRTDPAPARRIPLATEGSVAGVLRGVLADGRFVVSFVARGAPPEGGRGVYDLRFFTPGGEPAGGFESPASMPDFREMSVFEGTLLRLDYDADRAPEGAVRLHATRP